MDHFRKVKRKPAITTSDGNIFLKELEHTVPSADSNMLKGERQNRVGKMLDMLPEDQRDVIILRHYAGLSFKEIADLMHCSINTALGRMRYGLINLRMITKENQVAF
jgi:RNA polymerase sigma-70 factor (ECF subfamily)